MVIDQPDRFRFGRITFIDHGDFAKEVAYRVGIGQPNQLEKIVPDARQSFQGLTITTPHLPQTMQRAVPIQCAVEVLKTYRYPFFDGWRRQSFPGVEIMPNFPEDP